MRLEFIGATIIFLSSTLAVGALVTSGVDVGLVGLVISYALNATSSLVSTLVDVNQTRKPLTNLAELAFALCERSGTEYRQCGTNVAIHRAETRGAIRDPRNTARRRMAERWARGIPVLSFGALVEFSH